MPLDRIPLYTTSIYRPGSIARYNGDDYTISHVSVSGHKLIVYLIGVGTFGETTGIDSELVEVTRTTIDFNRNKPRADSQAPESL